MLDLTKDQAEVLHSGLRCIRRARGLTDAQRAVQDALETANGADVAHLRPSALRRLKPLTAQLGSIAERAATYECAPTEARAEAQRARGRALAAIAQDIDALDLSTAPAPDRLNATLRERLRTAYRAHLQAAMEPRVAAARQRLAELVWAERWADFENNPDVETLERYGLTALPHRALVAFRNPETGRWDDGLRVEPLKPEVRVPSNLADITIWVGGRTPGASSKEFRNSDARQPEALLAVLHEMQTLQREFERFRDAFDRDLASAASRKGLLQRRPDVAELVACTLT